ncbi:hypothetical protein E1171_02565 [Cytophagales bacterium RKSG123]|nr:hypothetical protein [Xanthovirga aplysinae]
MLFSSNCTLMEEVNPENPVEVKGKILEKSCEGKNTWLIQLSEEKLGALAWYDQKSKTTYSNVIELINLPAKYSIKGETISFKARMATFKETSEKTSFHEECSHLPLAFFLEIKD